LDRAVLRGRDVWPWLLAELGSGVIVLALSVVDWGVPVEGWAIAFALVSAGNATAPV
jgi:hypothetical protein